MTDEEKEAIEFVDDFIDGYRLYDVNTHKIIIPYKYNGGQRYVTEQTLNSIQTLLYLIQKQQEEIEELRKQSRNLDKEAQAYFEKSIGDTGMETRTIILLQKELQKKDKIIDAMAEYIINLIKYNNPKEIREVEEIKQYFERKVEK